MYFPSQAKEFDQRYSSALRQVTGCLTADWRVAEIPARSFTWTLVQNKRLRLPDQGWKLHVSCSADQAAELLQAVLPLLIDQSVGGFKVPSNLQGVLILNAELAGRTQAGKILTIYPATPGEARRVVPLLASAWKSSRGPRVLSDLPVRGARDIYMRYGLFRAPGDLWDSLGRPVHALAGPCGELREDVRSLTGQQPSWAPPPPLPGDTPGAIPGNEIHCDGHRYSLIRRLSIGLRVDTVLALDRDTIELCVLKRARRGIMGDLNGRDAMSRLRNEFRVLGELSGKGYPCARPLSYEESAEEVILVQSYIGDGSLSSRERAEAASRITAYAGALADLHSLGFVHRDIKLANAVRDRGTVRLIDLELAARSGEADPVVGGTPGYVPPEGAAITASPKADSYAFGGTVFEAATGMSPMSLPYHGSRGRMLRMLYVHGMPRTARLVRELTATDPARRPTIAQARGRLAEAAQQWELAMAGTGDCRGHGAVVRTGERRRARFAAMAATASISATRRYIAPQDSGHAWHNAHIHTGMLAEGINVGAAGIILGLLTLQATSGAAGVRRDVEGACAWLASRHPQAQAHGLFTGNAGVAVALGTAGRRFGIGAFRDAARARLLAATARTDDFDLFSGAAGVVLAACILARVLEQDSLLLKAAHQAEMIRAAAVSAAGVPCWTPSPLLRPDLKPYFGVAHGSAGIALALSAWATATGCDKSRQLAADTLGALCDLALTEASGRRRLPEGPQKGPRPVGAWCHGTAGLVWAMLQSRCAPQPWTSEIEQLTPAVLQELAAIGNPTYCHGLASILELCRLLEFEGLCEAHARSARVSAAESLRCFFQRVPDGTWPSEAASDLTPDLWVGFLGPAAALAMDARQVPSALLSPEWLSRLALGPDDRSAHCQPIGDA